jgi:hypothetical protein
VLGDYGREEPDVVIGFGDGESADLGILRGVDELGGRE